MGTLVITARSYRTWMIHECPAWTVCCASSRVCCAWAPLHCIPTTSLCRTDSHSPSSRCCCGRVSFSLEQQRGPGRCGHGWGGRCSMCSRDVCVWLCFMCAIWLCSPNDRLPPCSTTVSPLPPPVHCDESTCPCSATPYPAPMCAYWAARQRAPWILQRARDLPWTDVPRVGRPYLGTLGASVRPQPPPPPQLFYEGC